MSVVAHIKLIHMILENALHREVYWTIQKVYLTARVLQWLTLAVMAASDWWAGESLFISCELGGEVRA